MVGCIARSDDQSYPRAIPAHRLGTGLSPVSSRIGPILDYSPVTVVAVKKWTTSARLTPLAGYGHQGGVHEPLIDITDHVLVGAFSPLPTPYNTGVCDETMIPGLSLVVDARVYR